MLCIALRVRLRCAQDDTYFASKRAKLHCISNFTHLVNFTCALGQTSRRRVFHQPFWAVYHSDSQSGIYSFASTQLHCGTACFAPSKRSARGAICAHSLTRVSCSLVSLDYQSESSVTIAPLSLCSSRKSLSAILVYFLMTSISFGS